MVECIEKVTTKLKGFLNKESADCLTAIFLSLYSKENEDRWCDKRGFDLVSCDGDGEDGGYEPKFRNGWY